MAGRMSDREPVHAADLDAVRATLRWGVRLTLVVAVACIAYVAFAPGVEHSAAIMALAAIAIPGTLAVSRVDAAWLAGWEHRNRFWAGWSLSCIALVSCMVALDRADGPLAALFFL